VRGRTPISVTVAVAIAALASAAPASAASLTVNTTSDTVAVNPAVSALDSGSNISLRSAIQRANVDGDPTNTITLPAGTYKITIDPISAMTDDDSAGDFNVENGDSLTITGAGAATTIIDANDLDRAFQIDFQSSLTLSGATVENGLPLNPRPTPATTANCPSVPPTSGADGGAILQNGNLDLENDVITGNLASGPGGGIANEGVGDMTIHNTTISHNVICLNPGDVGPSFGPGAGVYDTDGFGSDLIDSSTIVDNTTSDDFGGGVFDGGGGSYTITNTTISGNSAGGGGGIETQSGEGRGSLTLVGDTISGNTATEGGFTAPGGGIENDGVEVSITNTTITGNTASDGGGIASPGGDTNIAFSTITGNTATGETEVPDVRGLAANLFQPDQVGPLGANTGNLQNTDGGNFTLDNTIVAGGISPSGDPTNCGGGGFTSNGFNLFDNNDSSCNAVASDLINTNPLVSPLANNGGPTQTEAIGLSSPALNAANPGAGVCTGETASIDQRGVTRPQGPRCDIGAFELEYADMQVSSSAAPTTIVVGGQATFTDTVTNAGPSTAQSATFSDPAAGDTINAASTTQGTCTHTATTVSCNFGTMNSGAHATITIVVTGTSAGTLTLTSSVASPTPDPNLTNNHATATVNVVAPATPPKADLAITKKVSPTSTEVGNNLTYTLTVTNKGPQTGTGVVVTDKLPSGLTLVSRKTSRGKCSGSASIKCTLGTLAVHAHVTITIVVHTTKSGSFRNTAHVTGTLPDPNLHNNTDNATATVAPPPLAVCTQKLTFKTRFREQRHDVLRQDRVATVKAYIDGRLITTKHGHDIRAIVITTVPPKGKHSVSVWFVFADGEVVTETRMYTNCRPGPAHYSFPPVTGPGAS
jgi:uncharacterized repeat protein (TIGR01451 family)